MAFGAETVGVRSTDLAMRLLRQVHALGIRGGSGVEAAQMLQEFNPISGIQALLAAQMIGSHEAAMQFIERAVTSDPEAEDVDAHVERAVKLMRVFTDQATAMGRLGKG